MGKRGEEREEGEGDRWEGGREDGRRVWRDGEGQGVEEGEGVRRGGGGGGEGRKAGGKERRKDVGGRLEGKRGEKMWEGNEEGREEKGGRKRGEGQRGGEKDMEERKYFSVFSHILCYAASDSANIVPKSWNDLCTITGPKDSPELCKLGLQDVRESLQLLSQHYLNRRSSTRQTLYSIISWQ